MLHYRTLCLAAMLFPATQAVAQQNVVILLDDSGSMNQSMRSDRATKKMTAAKEALRIVLNQLPDNAKVGVMVLNGQRSPWVIPFGPLDKEKMKAQINRVRANGATPLGKHMKLAADALLDARQKQRYGTYQLLILTDGEAGDANLVERYLPQINGRGIVIDVIGVDMKTKHSLATRTNSYRSADNPESLKTAISEVLAETSADSDAAQSDFELLKAFPDEIAAKALDALANPSNEPVSSSGQRPNKRSSSYVPHPPTYPATESSRRGLGPGRLTVLASIVFVSFLVAKVFRR